MGDGDGAQWHWVALGWLGVGLGCERAYDVRERHREPGRPEVWGKTPNQTQTLRLGVGGVELRFTRSPPERMMDPVVSLG